MGMNKRQLGRAFWQALCAGGLLALAGCGGLKLVPVSGTVTLGDQPLKVGRVLFNPDATKGNNARVACVGRIRTDGRYELYTTGVTPSENGKGVPLGWYKVTLLNATGSTELDRLVNPIYFDENKTPLSIEVVADPPAGAYDLKLKR
jgi:hypothetical protein